MKFLVSFLSRFKVLPFIGILFAGMNGCNSIDCPLDNVVVCTYVFYNSEERTQVLPTGISLSITLPNRDTTLLNQATNISSFTLPISYLQSSDTLLFHLVDGSNATAVDTLIYTKSNTSHFEDITCPTAVFHTINSVKYISQDARIFPVRIDSVAISRALVNYDDVENIKIFLSTE